MQKYLIIVCVFFLAVSSCKYRQQENKKIALTDSLQQKNQAVQYTCPMHHQIREDKPGKCPICGMTLIPIEDHSAMKKMDSTAQLMIPPRQQMLAGIHTDTAQVGNLSNQLVLTGTTIFDPQKENTVSAWVSGWIEKLYVRNPGEKINIGEKLYDLYSPDLLSAEKDYLLAKQQKNLFKQADVDFTSTIQAMEQKLLRWGLSQKEINNLSKNTSTGNVPIYSKTSGFLMQKMKEEGDYVQEGDVVFSLVDNNIIWVQAQLYDKELAALSANPKIWVSFDAGSTEKIPGAIAYNNPINQTDSRIHLLNISIPNTDGKLQPGMLAYVYLQTGKGSSSVLIPKSAIIYGEKNNYAWVALPNNKYERREVKLGNDNSTMVQVLQGINAGEKVVSSGAYLVNSEYDLKYGAGVNLSGMQMSDMKMSGKSK